MKRFKSFFLIIVLFLVAAFAMSLGSSWSTGNDEGSEMIITVGEIELNVLLADTPSERARGLSNMRSLEPFDGMLFTFPRPGIQEFWMKDMKFPIDIVWLRDGVVTGVSKNIPPEIGVSEKNLRRYKSPGLVDAVLELPAGESQILGIFRGTEITL